MNEFIKTALRVFPSFVRDFGELVSDPKTALRRPVTDAQALTFFGVALLLTMSLRLPMVPAEVDLSRFLPFQAAFHAIAMFAGAACLTAAWRLVGGASPFKKVLPAYAYVYGFLMLVLTVFLLVRVGVTRVPDRELYGGWMRLIMDKGVLALPPRSDWLALLIDGAALALALVWFWLAWGFFRELNDVQSRVRSFLAWLTFGVLSLSVAAGIATALGGVNSALRGAA